MRKLSAQSNAKRNEIDKWKGKTKGKAPNRPNESRLVSR